VYSPAGRIFPCQFTGTANLNLPSKAAAARGLLWGTSVNVKEPAVYRASVVSRDVQQLFHITIRETGARVPWWNDLAPDGSPLLLRDESSEEIYALEFELP
jgi:hypothetical protein